jgi:hypothetical protein
MACTHAFHLCSLDHIHTIPSVSDNNKVALMAKRGKSISYEGEEDTADTEYHEQIFCYIDVLKGGVIPIQIWPF